MTQAGAYAAFITIAAGIGCFKGFITIGEFGIIVILFIIANEVGKK